VVRVRVDGLRLLFFSGIGDRCAGASSARIFCVGHGEGKPKRDAEVPATRSWAPFTGDPTCPPGQ